MKYDTFNAICSDFIYGENTLNTSPPNPNFTLRKNSFEEHFGEKNETAVNPLPDIPLIGSSNSAGIKDMMLKIWTNGDTII